nr:MAG TPA: hypothetical protein [Caudoviricetes sp.]
MCSPPASSMLSYILCKSDIRSFTLSYKGLTTSLEISSLDLL